MAGVPDELERLWTPYRMAYISGGTAPAGGYDSPDGCPFCRAPQLSEEDGLVVARGQHVYAVLNRFPYNPGHLLICPYRHVADYTDLDEGETRELAQFTQNAMTVTRGVSAPAGFNIGMNQGAAAGAGIAVHLHQHVVPRWSGDTNFMPVVGLTKVLPQLLVETRALLSDAWNPKPVRSAPRAPRKGAAGEPAPTKARAQRAGRAGAGSTKESPAPARANGTRRRTG